MGLIGQLYRLQQVDLEILNKQRELTEIEASLADNKMLVTAESRLLLQKEKLQEAKKRQRECEWELEDLHSKIKEISDRLYSGKTASHKELVNLEKEIGVLRNQVRLKEDALLGLMGEVEEMEQELKVIVEEVQRLKREWEQRQQVLKPRKEELQAVLTGLKQERNELVQQIDSNTVTVYERLRASGGQAVVKVERGKCQGCHIAVPTSQWQKVRVGELVQCNSCSRILYVE